MAVKNVEADGIDASAASERHGDTHFSFDDGQQLGNAGPAARAERIGPRTAEHDTMRTKREHSDDIEPRADAAIGKDCHAIFAARCDIGPAADDLDWQPKRSLEEGLRALLHWIDEQSPMTARATAESTSPTR